MIRFLLVIFCFSISSTIIAQRASMNDYSYVVVPVDFEFTNKSDQFKLNSMTKFYLDKAGFNTYFSNETPNANRCEGLYANVEKLQSFMMTKLQLVLTDCEGKEVYRSLEGKTKVKEYESGYQDALRKAMSGLNSLRIKQKKVIPTTKNELKENSITYIPIKADAKTFKTDIASVENALPEARFTSYSLDGNNFLLRKTEDGYSLYKESSTSADGLLLIGRISIIGENANYIEESGVVSEISFDGKGNMMVKNDNTIFTYKVEN